MSGGPIAIIQRCWSWSWSSAPDSLFLVKAGVSGVLIGLFGNYLFGYGESFWREASWMFLVFLFVYTFCLILLLPHLQLSQSYSAQNYSSLQHQHQYPAHFSPALPNGLTRIRSYLAFFPITHVISHSVGGGGNDGNENLSPLDSSDGHGMSIRISTQMDMAIDAIVAEYVAPWYTKISDDRSFLEQSKAIIQAVFVQLGEKLKGVDRNDFAKEAIQIIHIHWKEYTDAINKTKENGDDVGKHFKFVHTFLQDPKEVSRRYQYIVGRVIEELQIPELSSPVMCQFLAGILVKNFILYYMEMICQPSWINGNLMTLLAASGTMSVDLTGSSSQNSSSPASPLPDPSASPKGISLFSEGEDGIECPSSMCPSSTAESTPTKKSRSSSGRSASGSGSGSGSGSQSQDEWASGKNEQHHQNVNEEVKHFLDNVSSSIEEEVSSSLSDPPKTESESGVGGMVMERRSFHSKTGSNASNSSMTTTTSSVLSYSSESSKRPKDLAPLTTTTTSTAKGNSLRTLTTALGSVMQATAFPLLPSECYTEVDNCWPKQFKSTKLEEISESEQFPEDKDDEEEEANDIYDDSHSEDQGRNETGDEVVQVLVEDNGKESPSSSSGNKSMTSSHYYSFDEASKPKASSTSFFEGSTLSLDGAIESRNRQGGKDQLQLCSHEYKHSSESGMGIGKSTRSPVYEEPEDFAASIAKLRSLLEQKERKSSTPPLSASMTMEDNNDPGNVFESPPMTAAGWVEGNVIPQISETCASDPHTTPSSTSSMDNSKASSRFSFNEAIIPSETDSTIIDPIEKTNYDEPVPEIKCCFRNISIPKVENSADAGGQSMFYCIQYEGVYYDEKEEGQPQKLVYRTTTIKRKFKEFLTLQAHLEENPAVKPHLKGMKTPTRWSNVSLTKSDAIVAHQRKAMLEKYLEQLCYHPIIGFCHEVLIFMAYGEDGFCSFEVGDPKDLLTHRLDKLAKKFTGVFNSLKDALPSFELDLSPAPNTPKSGGVTPSDVRNEAPFTPFPFQDKFQPLDDDDEDGEGHKPLKLESPPWMDKLDWVKENPEGSKDDTDNQMNELSGDSPPPEVEEGKIFSTYPLAAAVTQLLCDVLWLPQYRPHAASVATFMSISGKSLENYVVETMDIFLSEEAILGYLEWLTITINNGQSDTDSSRYDTSNEFCSEQDLKNIVKRRIPAWVRWMWGRNRLDLTIDRITGLLQNSLVNHDLVLSLCELLFSKVVSVEESQNHSHNHNQQAE